MRKLLLTPLVLCLVALLSAFWMPAVPAQKSKCDQFIVYDEWDAPGPHPDHLGELGYWKGDITGGITAICYFWELPNKIVGNEMHFFEDFYFDLGDGWVSGYDEGIWNFVTFNYRAHGWITDASENYADMIGCMFSEEGVTSNPDVLPISGTGTCWIGPPTGKGHAQHPWLRIR